MNQTPHGWKRPHSRLKSWSIAAGVSAAIAVPWVLILFAVGLISF